MAKRGSPTTPKSARTKPEEAVEILKALGFGPKQSNEVAAYTLLALLDVRPEAAWRAATNPLRGITPIIEFVREAYAVRYAPNTRETIRDEAVKYFVDAGLVVRNPDDPARPTNSGKTVYQVEPSALRLCQSFGSTEWAMALAAYLASREHTRHELHRHRLIARIAVTLPSGDSITLSPGGQNPLIKQVIEEFCPRFTPGAMLLYVGDAENKFLHLDAKSLSQLGVTVAAAAKMPDVVVFDSRRNWLVLIEAVTSAGPVDGKRRKELKELFAGSTAGLVFVTAFTSRDAMRSFLSHISWETEVWIAEAPDHLIHFNGERFLGPYPDVMPSPPMNN
ncbi:MAG: BsuBI/PstI family type II restriction endonuclease [Planctomycetales bacterium]|nr:BsuBI/PstI family type II restriction endonuclease [Planctomycetales bacterium]